MEEKQTRFVESSDTDIENLVANPVPKYSTNIQQDVMSTSLKVKNVTLLSDLVLCKLSVFIK